VGEVVTTSTDWKSLAEEAAMDLDECPVEGCNGKPRHRGRHNKRGLLPSTRAELDKAVKKKRGPKSGASAPDPNVVPEVILRFDAADEPEPEPEQAEPNQVPDPLPDGRYRDPLQRRVEAFYGVGNDIRGRGRVIAFSDAPQVLIQYEDGRKEWWRRDLTRDVTCPTCDGTGMVP